MNCDSINPFSFVSDPPTHDDEPWLHSQTLAG
jgi:hypothetical protein